MDKHIVTVTLRKRMDIDPDEAEEALEEEFDHFADCGWDAALTSVDDDDPEFEADDMEIDDE